MPPLVDRGAYYGGKVYSDIREAMKREDSLHFCYDVFDAPPVCFDDAGYGDPTGSEGDENRMISAMGNYFEYHIIGSGGQTILCPAFGADGLDIALDQANGEGMEMTQGITARSRGAFTCRTAKKPFLFKVELAVEDVSGVAELAVGFRKAEAYQALIDNYDEMACLNMQAGVFNIETILNGGATATTPTTDTAWANEATHSFTVKVTPAGVVTFEIDDAAPTVTATFTFDDAEVVIPFVHFMHASDLAGGVDLKSWECRYNRAVP